MYTIAIKIRNYFGNRFNGTSHSLIFWFTDKISFFGIYEKKNVNLEKNAFIRNIVCIVFRFLKKNPLARDFYLEVPALAKDLWLQMDGIAVNGPIIV